MADFPCSICLEKKCTSLCELHRYRTAEEQGLLVRLPCKVEPKIDIKMYESIQHENEFIVDKLTTFSWCERSIFFTREEAERKLKEG